MRRIAGVAAVAVLVVASGCAQEADTTELTVFAAASLTSSFQEIAEAFEGQHDGTVVKLQFAGSPDLVAQLAEGAPADVLATADTATMDDAVSQGLIAGTSEVFATNRMEIAVPPDNPAQIDDLDDLERDNVTLVVCAPAVPCGAAAYQVAENAGITLRPASEESSVSGVIGKVAAGEAEAGIVYVTDVANPDNAVLGVPIPDSLNVTNRYPVGVTASAREADLAASFVDFVQGEQGQAILAGVGFGAP